MIFEERFWAPGAGKKRTFFPDFLNYRTWSRFAVQFFPVPPGGLPGHKKYFFRPGPLGGPGPQKLGVTPQDGRPPGGVTTPSYRADFIFWLKDGRGGLADELFWSRNRPPKYARTARIGVFTMCSRHFGGGPDACSGSTPVASETSGDGKGGLAKS